ncbi:MAG: M50 family metallopeptidase [Candidatus Obscuribacterales bacterium]|nr:M50 family metallopeptidase [Candidatus Obscuribacterales bacterium]
MKDKTKEKNKEKLKFKVSPDGMAAGSLSDAEKLAALEAEIAGSAAQSGSETAKAGGLQPAIPEATAARSNNAKSKSDSGSSISQFSEKFPGGFNVILFWALLLFSVFFSDTAYVRWLLVPINQFVVTVHEMSHAIVTVLTGGIVTGMTNVSDGAGHGGITQHRGGISFLITQAGYLGQTFFGCLLIYLSQFKNWSRRILYLLGGIVLAGAIFFVLPGFLDLNGLLNGKILQVIGSLAWSLALAAMFYFAGKKLNDATANMLVLFLSVQCTLNSLSLIWILLPHSLGMTGRGFTDATSMQDITGIPAFVWAFSWMLTSIVAFLFTLRFTYGAFLFKKQAYIKPKK